MWNQRTVAERHKRTVFQDHHNHLKWRTSGDGLKGMKEPFKFSPARTNLQKSWSSKTMLPSSEWASGVESHVSKTIQLQSMWDRVASKTFCLVFEVLYKACFWDHGSLFFQLGESYGNLWINGSVSCQIHLSWTWCRGTCYISVESLHFWNHHTSVR